MSTTGAGPVKRVVIMVQENHTVDCYFGGLRPYGGNVATGWPLAQNPPSSDPPHDRSGISIGSLVRRRANTSNSTL